MIKKKKTNINIIDNKSYTVYLQFRNIIIFKFRSNNKMFSLNKLSDLFFYWELNFFKCKNSINYHNINKKVIQKYMLNSFSINNKIIYKENLLSFFLNFKKINIFLKLNQSNFHINTLIYNGFYLNFYFLKNWCFSNKIFSISYFVFFLKRVLVFFFNLMSNLIFKMLFLLKFCFLPILKKKKCLNI